VARVNSLPNGSPPQLPARTKVVIIGAGIVGNSLAYHLTQLGWSDVVLLDQGPMPEPGGSTGHASNFIFPVDHAREVSALILESMRQYDALGVLHESGGIEVARTPERMQELTRRMTSAAAWGIDGVRSVSRDEIQRLIPYCDASPFLGGAYTPTAGVVESVRAADIMRERAIAAGLRVVAETEVLDIRTAGGHVAGVDTSRGPVDCEYVVIAAGVWSPKLAAMAGAKLPLTPMIHQKVKVGPVPHFAGHRTQIEWPILRDMDESMYEHQKFDQMEIGSYAHRPITLTPAEIPSREASNGKPTSLPLSQGDFAPQMAIAREVLAPVFADPAVEVQDAINGVLSVTFDGMPLLGETPEIAGLWSAAAVWVREGPATGKTIAELMVHGESEIDIHSCEVARAHPHEKTAELVVARASEGFAQMYGIIHPGEQWASERDLRISPFHAREVALGAVFFQSAGWERPQWYASNTPLLEAYADRIELREAEWDARWWSPIITAEHLAMRDRAAMIDLSSFAIFDVTGPGAVTALQAIAMRQMDVAVGRVVYTPILTPSGGFRADLTIMRLAHDVFRVVTGGAHGMADRKWFADRMPADGSAQLVDLTSSWCTLGLWGPRARDILAAVTGDDISHTGFAFGTCKTIEVGPLEVLISRISYVGDLGWELYVPVEQGERLWDMVAEAGAPHGLIPAGIGVYATTGRLEKGYRAYGAELDAEYNVVEAGMAWGRVKDADFIGKAAHERHRAEAPAAVMCTLTVDDHTSAAGVKRYMLGSEPILTREGEPITDVRGRRSFVTSAGSGPSLGTYILMSYLPPEHAVLGRELAVEYLGERYPVTVASIDSTPLLDPENQRIRS
jgi:glycine cleavage system aminomethyltransferase T/glycine/D-amino acid oxidase-like deaminating enzyme